MPMFDPMLDGVILLSNLLLFILGLYLLRYVHPEGDHAQWSKADVPLP